METAQKKEKSVKTDLKISHRKHYEEYETKVHYHKNVYEFLLVLKGQGKFFIDDKTYQKKRYRLFLINKDTIHKSFGNKENYYNRLVLYFNEKYLGSYLKERDFNPNKVFKDRNYIQLTEEKAKKMKSVINKAMIEKKKKLTNHEILISTYMKQLLVFSERNLDNNEQANYDKTNFTDNEYKLKEIIGFIDNNYNEEITLKKISKKTGISKYHLCHYFKNNTGMTIIEYVNNKRIMEAQKLLKNNNENITDIAFSVGFNSLTHFSRTFKSTLGVTPTEYRKIHDQYK